MKFCSSEGWKSMNQQPVRPFDMVASQGDLKCKMESCKSLQDKESHTCEGLGQPCACYVVGITRRPFWLEQGEREWNSKMWNLRGGGGRWQRDLSDFILSVMGNQRRVFNRKVVWPCWYSSSCRRRMDWGRGWEWGVRVGRKTNFIAENQMHNVDSLNKAMAVGHATD